MNPGDVKNLIEEAGGTVKEMGALPDGSGFAVASFKLRKDHWIYGDPSCERFVCEHEGKVITSEAPPMPFRIGMSELRNLGVTRREEFAEKIRAAGRYAIRASTDKGKDMDFDPDALLQNLVVGLLGYWTANGLSNDDWANPE